MSNIIDLFTNKTTNGDSEIFVPIGHGTGSSLVLDCLVEVFGEFGGATVRTYWQARDGLYYPAQDNPWTKPDLKFAKLNSNISYKLVISGAGINTNLSATAYNAIKKS